MDSQNYVDGINRRLLLVIVGVVLMLALVFGISITTSKSRSQWDASIGDILERDFRVTLAGVIAEARLKGNVSFVEIQGRKIKVNRAGRPMVAGLNNEPDCGAIWFQVMGFEPNNRSYPVSPVVVTKKVDDRKTVACRFYGMSGDFFDYTPDPIK
ncbi:hypothetical protein [Echinimonas agarilytica]|uniref:Uncharacterized protein n=1 Tax=Echinimonas agarilytica TaxID=1215918 RepID=A0AA41W4A6_9GAMM|nr:hypothetical protein [Echinimonas agarilytica]MCM2678585.1 hypothetical protein [Echinimonas agarilytica]